MRRVIFVAVLLALALVVYAVGIIMLVTTPQANAIPTPGHAVVGGVLAMFATLCVFVTGFVWTATEPG
jgi:hypothetical protein